MSNQSLLPVQSALQQILKAFKPSTLESIPLDQAMDRVLAVSINSTVDLPPFTNSSMDGFAVRPDDVAMASKDSPTELTIVGDIPAGSIPGHRLERGQAMRIMTGAPLPDGAGAVVPVEETNLGSRAANTDLPGVVKIVRPARDGDFVRPMGEDLHKGELVLGPGMRLRPQELGMLATLGFSEVEVHRKPRVAILSTGDELVQIEQELSPGKIRGSNSHTLAAQVSSCGGEVIQMGIVPDDLQVLQDRLVSAVKENADLIITTAGVSVGAFDYVREAVEAKGQLEFWRVNMRPGKPLTFGSYQAVPFVGLPGNPVSAFVGFEVFLRPALNKMAGVRRWKRVVGVAHIESDVKSDGRESYLRGVVEQGEEGAIVRPAAHQGSGNLYSLVRANSLYIIPEEVKHLAAGAEVKYWTI